VHKSLEVNEYLVQAKLWAVSAIAWGVVSCEGKHAIKPMYYTHIYNTNQYNITLVDAAALTTSPCAAMTGYSREGARFELWASSAVAWGGEGEYASKPVYYICIYNTKPIQYNFSRRRLGQPAREPPRLVTVGRVYGHI